MSDPRRRDDNAEGTATSGPEGENPDAERDGEMEGMVTFDSKWCGRRGGSSSLSDGGVSNGP